ncbi:YraN family protein [Camelimonas fluminis]|uniref:UPF0102 protein ACFONL_17135 n=1 Tax=Camelimonas fluminis TaxID=1576911 RepID=A0ABV7UKJ6_9HYPH|nr:YraN family protein [Camelimonas fluminis]
MKHNRHLASGARGASAETIAAWLLRLKGYRILARRFRAGTGEIDLIAARGDVIAFVEVKARRRRDDAAIAITADKQRRIASAARIWLARHPGLVNRTLRLDAVFIGELSWRTPWRALRHGASGWPRHLRNIAPLPF